MQKYGLYRYMLDFNYMHIAVEKAQKYDEFDITLHCVHDRHLSENNRKDVLIYKITKL